VLKSNIFSWLRAKPKECKYWHKHLKGNKTQLAWPKEAEVEEAEATAAQSDTNIVNVKSSLKPGFVGCPCRAY